MSDEKDKETFDLDWDDALSNWERDVDSSAEAKSKPMPQKPPQRPPAPPTRALYQPPDPAEIARMRRDKHVSLADDEGNESTALANIPSIPRPTAPPAAPGAAPPDRATQRPASPELDLDDLLANLDEETRMYPADVPKVASAPAPKLPPKLPVTPRAGAPGPPRPRSPFLKAAGGAVPRPPVPAPVTRPEPSASHVDDVDLSPAPAAAEAVPHEQILMLDDDAPKAASRGREPVADDSLDVELDMALGLIDAPPTPTAELDDTSAPAPREVSDATVAESTPAAGGASASPPAIGGAAVDDDLDVLLGASGGSGSSAPPEPRASLEDELFGESVAAPLEATSVPAYAVPASLPGAPPPAARADTVAATAPSSPPVAPPPVSDASTDRGAQAARRTVRSRKPRREVFPLVGRQPPAVAARAELLEGAAQDEALTAPVRARALLAAAELRLLLGELDVVAAHASRAADLDPTGIAALRMARAVAAARRDVPSVASLLEREAAALPAGEAGASPERAVLFGAAADAWARAGDPHRASGAARLAYESQPMLLTALVALAHAAGEAPGAFAVLRRASAGALVSGIASHAAVRAAAGGTMPDEETASEPGVALAALGSGKLDPSQRAAMLASLVAGLDGALGEAARVVEVVEASSLGAQDANAEEALKRLGAEGTGPTSLALALESAIRTDHVAEEAALAERLAAHVEGPERAALLARSAILLAARGDLTDADALVRAATMADATSGAVQAVQARLAELDPARRAKQIETEGALAVAARMARDAGAGAQEVEVLERALERSDASPTPDVVLRDALAGLVHDRRSEETLRVAVRRAARAPTATRPCGLLLAGALSGDADAASEADAVAPSATTARARVLAAESTVDAAQAWADEAARATGEHAARASRESGRALIGSDGAEAAKRLAASEEGDAAAAALFAAMAERDGAPGPRAQTLARYAALDHDPASRARGLVRAALSALSAGDAEQTRSLLARASAEAADDPILNLMRWRDATGNGAEVPADVAERRAAAGTGTARIVLETHTALVRADAALLASLPELEPTSVAAVTRMEARRRRERLEASRLPVQAPADVGAAGDDLAALRALERASMVSLAGLEEASMALAEKVREPTDRASYLRVAYTASLRSAADETFEARVLACARASGPLPDPWLARRVAGLALRRGEPALAEAWGLQLAQSLSSPLERGQSAMHALGPLGVAVPTEVGAGPAGAGLSPHERLEILRAFQAGAAQHPLLSERVAELAVAAGEAEEGAVAYEQAARLAAYPARRARLFVAAADLHEEISTDPDRVVALLEEASKADVTYGGVFERLRTALERRGARERLSGLVARRLAAGGEGPQAVELFLAQASLRESAGDLDGARQALRSALELAPEHLGGLKKLAQLSLADEDYRAAAEALIRLAKLRRETEELRWVFFELAGIYDRHIPDVKRAEAAYRRVLKLVPDDAPAMERLAELYRREGMHPQAVEMLDALLKVEMDPDRARAHRLSLARIHEQAGDARRAEQTLETTRRASPTDLETLRALADFYGRQKAQTALAMHLNRAAQDFRHALGADLTDEAAWIGLVEVLGWRARHDSARAVATAAVALGVVDVEVAKLVDEHGGAPACHDLLASNEVIDLVAPAPLSVIARDALERLGPFIDKALAFDPKSHRAEKLPARDPASQRVLSDVGRWLGLSEIELWVASGAPRVCVPFASQPPAILVGREILAGPEPERLFLTARSVFIAKHKLAGVLRAPPAELAAMLAYVAQQFDSAYRPAGLDPAAIAEQGRRLAKHAPRKVLEEAGPLVFDMVGAPEYDPAKLAMAVSELGDRVALLATGSMPAALSAILRLAGLPTDATDVAARVASVRRSPEASALLTFAISEPHFEARRRSPAAG